MHPFNYYALLQLVLGLRPFCCAIKQSYLKGEECCSYGRLDHMLANSGTCFVPSNATNPRNRPSLFRIRYTLCCDNLTIKVPLPLPPEVSPFYLYISH